MPFRVHSRLKIPNFQFPISNLFLPMPAKKKTSAPAKSKEIASHTHAEATRKNIPSAEMQQVIGDDIKAPVPVTYARNAPPMSPETD
jgi:hypothetical protein